MPLLSTLVWLAGGIVRGQVTVTTAPANINLNYLQGAVLPATQIVSVKSSAGAPTYSTTIATVPANGLWITASPDTGTLPAKVSLHVNPTGLAVGTYTAAVTFTPVATVPSSIAGTANVKLVVTAPLPTLTFTNTLTFTSPPANPAPQTVRLTTSGGPVSFSASPGTSSWLTVAPGSGVVLPGAPANLTVTADAATLGAQVAAHTGKITLTETGSANKTQSIAVSFMVNYQSPTVTGLWPSTGKVGGQATTITIFGTNFGAATVVKIQGPPVIPLTTAYYGPKVISAVIPAAQMAAGNVLSILVTNPAPGGDSVTAQNFTFTPTLDAAVNTASYAAFAAPGELITLFGENIGPATPLSLNVTSGYVDKVLGGIGVKVNNLDAPIVYVSQHQITVQVPYGVGTGLAKTIVVTNAGNPSGNGAIDIAATAPGIFTVDGVQAAAINTSAVNGAVSINSAANVAHIGDAISLYVTGEGVYTSTPTPADGYVIPLGMLPGAMPVMSAPVTVTIGGVAALVTYKGPFDGGMLGVLQINATVPAHTTGPAVPVVVNIGGVDAQTGIQLATKP